MQVRFRSEAVEDVEAAKAWYNEQRDGEVLNASTPLDRMYHLRYHVPHEVPCPN